MFNFSNSTKAIPSMLRHTNHGMKQIDENFFNDDSPLWDKQLRMPHKFRQDFQLDPAKRRYADYLESPVMFIMPRQSTNKALNRKPKMPNLDNVAFLSNQQKALYNHIQRDTIELDTFEIEVALLRPDMQEPLVTRRTLADGDPVHLSLR